MLLRPPALPTPVLTSRSHFLPLLSSKPHCSLTSGPLLMLCTLPGMHWLGVSFNSACFSRPTSLGSLASSLHSLPSLSSCLVVYCWENPLGEHMLTWSSLSLFAEFGGSAPLLSLSWPGLSRFPLWITAPAPHHLLIRFKTL